MHMCRFAAQHSDELSEEERERFGVRGGVAAAGGAALLFCYLSMLGRWAPASPSKWCCRVEGNGAWDSVQLEGGRAALREGWGWLRGGGGQWRVMPSWQAAMGLSRGAESVGQAGGRACARCQLGGPAALVGLQRRC